ncbi:MAG: hypothetical protein IJ033_00905 [Clostridia bacterium]|nr:hypothetical protein [Clostridia bacterium]
MSTNHELHYTPNNITVLGVKEVLEFSEREIILSLEHSGLRVSGKELKLIEADMEKGVLKASGTLSSLNYGGGAKESLVKKLFK